jgi:hypothetical protein
MRIGHRAVGQVAPAGCSGVRQICHMRTHSRIPSVQASSRNVTPVTALADPQTGRYPILVAVSGRGGQ